jgi:hypothetical protein
VATSSSPSVVFPARAEGDLQVLFVENSHLAPMTGTVSRTTAAGTEEAEFSLPGAGRFALDLDEIFGSTADDGCVITINASSPVLAMGTITDELLSQVRLIAGR